MKVQWWRALLPALVVALAACSDKGPSELAGAAGSVETQNASEPSKGSDSLAAAEERSKALLAGEDPRKVWERVSQAAQAELAKPGADPSDVAAKANELGADPQNVFNFMRDRIALEPYAGVLRGARGTLAAGAGNALDRALLAQELLKTGGIESRVVAGKLSDSQADALLARFLNGEKMPQVLRELAGPPDDSQLKAAAQDLSGKTGIAESRATAWLEQGRSQGERFWAKTDAQRATQFDYLSSQLKQSGSKAAIDGASLTAKLKARLRDHYWLQVKDASGAWSAFDPSFADAKRGTTYGASAKPLQEIPAEEFHQLEFSLVYRTGTEAAPKDEVLIAGTFASADALFAPLEFQIQPVNVGADLQALSTMDAKQKIELLKKVNRFQGVLRSGPKVTGGRKFDLDGNTYDPGDNTLGQAAGSFFGDSLGGGGDEAPPPQFQELRVVMRLTGPGRTPMSQTRTLLRAEDLLSQTFAPPIVDWDLFLQPQWISEEFVGARGLEELIATVDAGIKETSAGGSAGRVELPPSSPVLTMHLALLRQSATAGILAKENGVRALIDEPMLTIFARGLTGIHPEEGKILGGREIDIVENGVRFVAKDDQAQAAAFDAALRQSVADSTLEDRLLRDSFPNDATTSGTSIVEQSRVDKRPVLLAHALDSDKLKSAGVSKPDVEWINENESPTAQLVVATTSAGSAAWWSVGPDGSAVLRTNGGRGDSIAEYVLITTEMGLAGLCAWEAGTYFAQRSVGGSGACLQNTVIACALATYAAPWLAYGGIVFHTLHYVSWGLALADLGWAVHHWGHCG